MGYVSVLNSLILICLVFWLISINADPDTDLCADLTLDAAVLADGYQPYVFKGDYYWRLDLDLGIVSDYGEKITDLWPGLPTPIDAAFSVDEKTHGRSTVFIAGEKWYHYKGSKQVNAGKTNQWPNFPNKTIDAAFTLVNTSIVSRDYEVYIFFGAHFILYSFQDIRDPTFIATNKASTAGNFLYFLVDHVIDSDTNIQDTIQIKAGVTDRLWIVLFGVENYCKANATHKRHLCTPKPVIDFYKCPRESRPEVTTSSEEDLSTETMTDKKGRTVTKKRTDLTDQEDLTTGDDKKTSTETLPVEAEQKKENSGKSSSTFLIFVIIFFVIVVIAIVVVVVAFVVIKNKRKETSFKAKPRTPSMDSITDDNDDEPDEANDGKEEEENSLAVRSKSRKSTKDESRSDNNDNDFNGLSAKSNEKSWE